MYPSRSIRILCTVLPAALIALAPAAARAFKEVDALQFPPVTLLPAVQNVRLNLTNVAIGNPDFRPGSCQLEVIFLDASGQALGDGSVLELRPGESATVMGPEPHMRDWTQPPEPDRTTRLLRAMVRFIGNPDFRGVGNPDFREACNVVPVMEVFSKETGATLFLSPAVLKGFNPQPDPPGKVHQTR